MYKQSINFNLAYPAVLYIGSEVFRGSEVSIILVKCSLKCSEVLQCNDSPSNMVSNIIIRLIDNRKLLLICIFLLLHSLIFF